MSIKRASKLLRFFTYISLSLVVGGLAFLLNKKQRDNYSVLLDKDSSVVHADAGGASFGTGGGNGDGNDSGSGDGC